jgi:hypothetical protein
MSRIVFTNPNDPEQPAAGVYRWFIRSAEQEITIYVGRAGHRGRSVGDPSTLKRGILEAQRSCITSQKARMQLDTDFVVGTALRYLKAKGFDCFWQHLPHAPTEERVACATYKPLLQRSSANIHSHFKPPKPGGAQWEPVDIELAHQLVCARFDEHLRVVP